MGFFYSYMGIIEIVFCLCGEGFELALFVFVAPEIGTEVEGDDIFGEGGVRDYGIVLSFRDGCAGGGGEERT